MTLTLTSEDQQRLTGLLREILSPFDHASHIEWRRAVCVQLKALTGADKATFVFALPGENTFFSDELDAALLHRYPDAIYSIDRQLGIARRHVELGVYNRELLWQGHMDEFHKSTYHSEYVVPNKLFDAIGLADAPGGNVMIGAMPNIVLHHDSQAGPKFGSRGVELLGILLPAFRSTARLLSRTMETNALQALAESLEVPVLIVDGIGLQLRSPIIETLLRNDPERQRLESDLQRMALEGLHLASSKCSDLSVARRCVSERQVRTCRGLYRCRLSLLREPNIWPRPLAFVVVQPPTTTPVLSATELRKRFGLTPREAEIALLLACRRTEGEIAASLGISVHTARRHTERVLQKLGVASRREVNQALAKAGDRA